MKSISLYNQDGSLCSEAQLLLSPKLDAMSIVERRKRLKEFKSQLAAEDFQEFKRLKAKKYNAKWQSENPEKAIQCNTTWRAKNPEKLNKNNAKWRAKNPEKRTSYMNNYHKQRKVNDPLYRLQCNMRIMGNRVVRQLSLGKKPTCTEKWQGCSADELKAHIESLFQEGMNWNNYGKHGWHVDHLRPVSSFAPEEWEQINHYTNLQPLWAEDNYKKSNSF